jgi:hypothetical protein
VTTPFHKPPPGEHDDPTIPQFLAAVDLIGRTGARDFEFRLSEPDEELSGRPVFVSIASYRGGMGWDAGAGATPLASVERLLDQLLDGGQCTHCHRPTGVAHNLGPMPLAEQVCWYQYDPELKTYRRACE